MSFNTPKPSKDPFLYGNAMIEYKDGKPTSKVPLARSNYKPSFGTMDISNQNEDMVVLELEDDA